MQNRIQKIENLDCLQNLTFITMAANQISKIEGLTHFKKLAFLDLSQNQIISFDIGKHGYIQRHVLLQSNSMVHLQICKGIFCSFADELPQSLVILSLKDNPCTSMPDYRYIVLCMYAGRGGSRI